MKALILIAGEAVKVDLEFLLQNCNLKLVFSRFRFRLGPWAWHAPSS